MSKSGGGGGGGGGGIRPPAPPVPTPMKDYFPAAIICYIVALKKSINSMGSKVEAIGEHSYCRWQLGRNNRRQAEQMSIAYLEGKLA